MANRETEARLIKAANSGICTGKAESYGLYCSAQEYFQANETYAACTVVSIAHLLQVPVPIVEAFAIDMLGADALNTGIYLDDWQEAFRKYTGEDIIAEVWANPGLHSGVLPLTEALAFEECGDIEDYEKRLNAVDEAMRGRLEPQYYEDSRAAYSSIGTGRYIGLTVGHAFLINEREAIDYHTDNSSILYAVWGILEDVDGPAVQSIREYAPKAGKMNQFGDIVQTTIDNILN